LSHAEAQRGGGVKKLNTPFPVDERKRV